MKTELYWVEGPWPCRLAILPRPRGGDWLDAEVLSWRQAGVDVAVSLLTSDEVAELGLTGEEELCRANGIEFLTFPIPDREVPSSKEAASGLLTRLFTFLAEGKSIAIHCRQGIGRAGLIAICLLVLAGIDSATAIQRLSAARGCAVPETSEQRKWVEAWVGYRLENDPRFRRRIAAAKDSLRAGRGVKLGDLDDPRGSDAHSCR